MLGEILDLTGEEAAEVLGTDATTYRKRLSRARERLAETLGAHCGPAAERNACRCHRRLRRALEMGRIIAAPQMLGDNYEEMVESLNRLADSELGVVIVPRAERGDGPARQRGQAGD